MSKETYDVVIVGAGIVGAACADAFAERGLRVAIVDRDVIGSGATAAGMGHIVVMDDSDAQFALTRYSQRLWQALRAELPADTIELCLVEPGKKLLEFLLGLTGIAYDEGAAQ